MSDLYDRLSAAGFDRQFVRDHVLPDWWDDELATNPATRAIAELTIARMLGFDVAALRNHAEPLTLPPLPVARLKHSSDINAARIPPTIRIAERMIRNLKSSLVAHPAFAGERSAGEIREAILASALLVDLGSLLDFAWDAGIVVTRLSHRPAGSGKLHGIAMFCNGLPAIVLTEARDGPSWQAFRLGHKLGHIFLGHVQPGAPPVADSDPSEIDAVEREDDEEETAANRFACELLTGHPETPFQPAPNREWLALALWARDLGERDRIDPGTLLLLHAHAMAQQGINRYAGTTRALKSLGHDVGALDAIDRRLAAHLSSDRSETADQAAALAGVV